MTPVGDENGSPKWQLVYGLFGEVVVALGIHDRHGEADMGIIETISKIVVLHDVLHSLVYCCTSKEL